MSDSSFDYSKEVDDSSNPDYNWFQDHLSCLHLFYILEEG